MAGLMQSMKSIVGLGRGAAQVDTKTRSGFNVSEFQQMFLAKRNPWNRGKMALDREEYGIPYFPDQPMFFSPEMAEAVQVIADDVREQKTPTIKTMKNLAQIEMDVGDVEIAYHTNLAPVVKKNAEVLEALVDSHKDINQSGVKMIGKMQEMGRSVRQTDQAILVLEKYNRGMSKARNWGV